jgi:nucleotide-binding universal stress UspA family protein
MANPGLTKFKHILVPLDGSANAEQALPAAQILAQGNDAKILLLRVLQALDAGSQKILFASEEQAKATFAAWRADAEQEQSQIVRALQATGIAAEQQVILGDPVPTIFQTIGEQTIDVIVMTTHGYTGLKRWYYGSVANKVLRGANCPVLLVRSQPDKANSKNRPT